MTSSFDYFTKLNNGIGKYNELLSQSQAHAQSWVTAISSNNAVLGEYLTTVKDGSASLGGYIKYLISAKSETLALSIAQKTATIVANAFKVALNMAVVALVSYGIEKIVEYVSNLKTASEQAKEELDATTQNLTDVNSKVNDLNTQLQDTNKQIETLKSKGSLTFVEKTQLTALEQTSAQLRTQLEIQEALQKLEKEKQTNAAIKSFDAHNEEKIDPFTGAVNTDVNIDAKSGMEGINQSLAFYSDRIRQVNKDQKEYNELLSKGNNLTDEEKQKKETLAYILKDDDASTAIKENLLNRAKAYQEEANLIDVELATDKKSAQEKKQSALDQANAILKVVDAENYAKNQTDSFNSVWTNTSYDKKIQNLADLAKQGKLTADTLDDSKYSDVKKAFGDVGISAKDATQQINALSKEELNNAGTTDTNTDSLTKLSDAMKTFQTASSIWQSAKKDVSDYGAVSLDTLQKIVKQYPQLETVVSEYQSGIITTSQLISDLKSVYDQDENNYKQSLLNKLSTNDKFYSQTVLKNSKFVSEFKNLYGVDLTNYKNLAQAKSEVDNKLLKNLIDNWSQFYNAQTNTFTEDFAKLGMSAGQGNKESLAKVKEIELEVGQYRKAIDSLNNISLKGVNLNTDSLGSGSSKKSGSSKSKSTENTALKNAEAELEYRKQMGEFTSDNLYKQISLNQAYLAGVENLKKYAKTTDEIRDINVKIKSAQEAVTESTKKYQQDNLDRSYKELETRIALGKVQENSKAHLQNLLEIQKNLNSATMSLVNTEENRLAVQEKIYAVQKAMREADKSNIESLLSITENMVKQQYQDEEDVHKKRINNLNDELDKIKEKFELQKKALDQEKDAYDHNQQQSEKEKAVSDLQSQIAIVSADTSDAGIKKKLELQEQLSKAQQELTDYQFNYSIDQQKQALEDAELLYEKKYKAKTDELQEEVDAIEKSANDEVKIRERAMNLINSKSKDFYDDLVEYNQRYGDGLTSTISTAWSNCYNSLMNYNTGALNVLSTLEKLTAQMQAYSSASNSINTKATRNQTSISSNGTYTVKKGDTLAKIADWFGISLSDLKSANSNVKTVTVGQKVNIPHYSLGTNYSQGGLIQVDESGYEAIFRPTGGGRYTLANEGSWIFTNEMTKNLQYLSSNPIANQLKNMFQSNALPSVTNNNNNSNTVNVNFNIAGNADESVLKQLKAFGNDIKASIFKEMNQARTSSGSTLPVTSK